MFDFFKIYFIFLFAKSINGNINVKTSAFEKILNIDIVGLKPINTVSVKQAPYECVSNCNQNELCDAFTSEPINENTSLTTCKFYAILRDNKCIANVTKVTSVGTSFYNKRNKGINATCKATKECTTSYGLQCIHGKCGCNKTQ